MKTTPWKCEDCGNLHWHGNFCGCQGPSDGGKNPVLTCDEIELDLPRPTKKTRLP
jgi:hypothetical protein